MTSDNSPAVVFTVESWDLEGGSWAPANVLRLTAVLDCVADLVLPARREAPPRLDSGGASRLPVLTLDGAPVWVWTQSVLE